MVLRSKPSRRVALGWAGIGAIAALVHAAALARSRPKPAPPSPPPAGPDKPPAASPPLPELPEPVVEMRDALLAAVRSGRIEDLKVALELNELPPEIADTAVLDPIAYWREHSLDGAGHEILAALGNIIDAGFAVVPLGPDVENNRLYVWPYLAERNFADLKPADEVALLRLVPADAYAAFKASGHYQGWRLVIGADGVWHSFKRQ